MRRLLALLVLGLALLGPALVLAQAVIIEQANGTLSTAGTDCATATSCVVLNSLRTSGGVITVGGTFTGTVQFEASLDGSTYFSLPVQALGSATFVTSTTSTGQFLVSAPLNYVRTRASALSSGSATISILMTSARGGSWGIAGGGGAGGNCPAGATGSVQFTDGTDCVSPWNSSVSATASNVETTGGVFSLSVKEAGGSYHEMFRTSGHTAGAKVPGSWFPADDTNGFGYVLFGGNETFFLSDTCRTDTVCIARTDNGNTDLAFYGTASGAYPRLFMHAANGSPAAPTDVTSGDHVGQMLWTGYVGGYSEVADILVTAATVSGSTIGGQLAITLAAASTTFPTIEPFRLQEWGSLRMTAREPSGTAPNAGGGPAATSPYTKLEWTCGSSPGTAKILAYAGASATAMTIIDNIGSATRTNQGSVC